jgi:hypothetical protein
MLIKDLPLEGTVIITSNISVWNVTRSLLLHNEEGCDLVTWYYEESETNEVTMDSAQIYDERNMDYIQSFVEEA